MTTSEQHLPVHKDRPESVNNFFYVIGLNFMANYHGQIETKNNKICFSFLEKNDFIRSSAFQQESKSFA
jgi:hypothetical protein